MPYVELRCKTHYSFLEGASSPQELMERAIELGYPALAITDRNGVYGIAKAYEASRKQKIKLITGAELTLEGLPSLTLLAMDRAGYGLICRLLSASHEGKEKGQAALSWEKFLKLMERPGNTGIITVPSAIFQQGAQDDLDYFTLKELFQDRLYIPISRFYDEKDTDRVKRALLLAKKTDSKLVATNDVHFHARSRRRLQDVMTSTRHGVTLKSAGFKLFSNPERYLKSPAQMRELFRDLPQAITNTLEVASRCIFSPSELKYRYPSEWIPKGHTATTHLTELVWRGAEKRYPSAIPEDVRAQLKHELKLIDELGFSDYFLTIWEIVEFARSRNILCQGRGSAANSSVCYCLGITAIDPVRMKLLFERFISAERGEPPDIDVDFEHERREEVIQHIYEKYGRDRAAMVSAVITYRSRSAIREVTKAFGIEMDKRAYERWIETPTQKTELVQSLVEEIRGFPRHLSIHSGGFTLSADPLIEIVPIEPARMDGRTIIQFDKYDLDILGLIKIDVLSLGMLSALHKAMDLVGFTDLAHIPAENKKTYEMIQRADTVGTFQIESRAQMSMLPRLLPKTFYDLVVEVALVRPGPIVGKMVHPYLKRRRGLEPVVFPDPRLEPILGRTLGVPLFQEQVMKIAIVLAGFTPGEADELRRAIGAWRSSGSIDKMGRRLMAALLANGIPKDFADLIFTQIQGFAEYGFPESHAASFALLAYASAYLKCHHPAEFTCALLNSQPMGFYSSHTLIDDAKRHGVCVLPIHPNISQWDCAIEGDALRIGWRYVHGIARAEVDLLLKQRELRPFQNLGDFLTRVRLRPPVLHKLALGGAFECFGYEQRQALWAVLDLAPLVKPDPDQLTLFQEHSSTPKSAPLDRTDEYQSICLDYRSYGHSTRGHPIQAIRKKFPHLPKMNAATAKASPQGRSVQVPGISVVMQRPPTAKGVVFATLEDETGFLDLIIHQKVFERFKEVILDHSFLLVRGTIQKDGGSVSMIVRDIRSFLDTPSPPEKPNIKPLLSEGVRFG